MPDREDDYESSLEGPKGRGLCPFCGGTQLYPSKRRTGWWECTNEKCLMYRRFVQSPSYGSGQDINQDTSSTTKASFGGSREPDERGINTADEESKVILERDSKRGQHTPVRKKKQFPSLLVVILLLIFGAIVWRQWGGDIISFFFDSTLSNYLEDISPLTSSRPDGIMGLLCLKVNSLLM